VLEQTAGDAAVGPASRGQRTLTLSDASQRQLEQLAPAWGLGQPGQIAPHPVLV
jgi:hypothetical protein